MRSRSSIPELNRLDLKGIHQQHPAATSQKVGSVKTAAGLEMPLYSSSGGGYSELVAYAEQPKKITVSADTGEQLKAARVAFKELLSSYVALGSRSCGAKEEARSDTRMNETAAQGLGLAAYSREQ